MGHRDGQPRELGQWDTGTASLENWGSQPGELGQWDTGTASLENWDGQPGELGHWDMKHLYTREIAGQSGVHCGDLEETESLVHVTLQSKW